MSNLRIIYSNVADTASLLASSELNSTTTPVTNLARDAKAKVWRSNTSSTTAVKAMIRATFSSQVITGVILGFTNNSPAATMTVRGYTGTPPTFGGTVDTPTISGGTLSWTVGPTLCCPPNISDTYSWGTTSYNAYEKGTGYSRLWLGDQTAVTCIVIEINDVATEKYVEVSRLIVGRHWSPVYNTSYGINVDYKDTSRSARSESGDLITSVGVRYATMGFDLSFMENKDRIELNRLNRLVGTRSPIFVSLFPDNSDDYNLEQIYQIYGKQTQSLAINHPMYSIFSSQMELEEI